MRRRGGGQLALLLFAMEGGCSLAVKVVFARVLDPCLGLLMRVWSAGGSSSSI